MWERPASVPIPTVWARYESKKAMPNGKTPIFKIQDYTDEWREDVVHNMMTFFVRDEVLCRTLNVLNDREATEEFREFFKKFLNLKMVLVAIVENLEELGDKKLPILAGCNITTVVQKDEEHAEVKSEKIKKIFGLLNILEEKLDCFKYYQTSEYLYAFGLSVNPAYRGHGLGQEILKARFPLCKAVGIKATVTVFTGTASQISATKAGFELLAEHPYDEFKDENGEIVFKVTDPKTIKLMGFRIL